MPSPKFWIESVDLAARIVSAFERGNSHYETLAEFAWLRRLGTRLMEQQLTLLMTVNLEKLTGARHWVNIAINPSDGTILYGDSMHAIIPENLHEAYTWWLKQHSPASISLDKYPISPQMDGHSCGILTNNAHHHFVDPNCKLVQGNEPIREHLRNFNLIADHVVQRV